MIRVTSDLEVTALSLFSALWIGIFVFMYHLKYYGDKFKCGKKRTQRLFKHALMISIKILHRSTASLESDGEI